MDDILASIRKIIADDEARAQVGDPPLRATPPKPMKLDSPTVTTDLNEPVRREDVLLLTDLIQEPMLAKHADESQPASIALPEIAPVSAPAMPIDSSAPPLVGEAVIGATASALDRLNMAVQESVTPVRAAEAGPALGAAADKTIEELVKDMLRPMLKDWLDRNLPPLVERYVEREIVRLTRR